jgi:hypothetical protein
MEVLLSDKQVKALAGRNARVITYPEIGSITTLDDLFKGRDKVIILYLNDIDGSDFVGHWVLLIRKWKGKKELIEFYDSYSNEIDEFFDETPDFKRKELGQDKGHLSRLLYNHCLRSGWKVDIIYNEIPVQKMSPDINTCGRWVGLRGHFSSIPLDDYQEEFKKLKREGYDLDKVVVALTNKLLKSKNYVQP